jgi:hypothetical protein
MKKAGILFIFILSAVPCFTNDGYYDIVGDTLHPIESGDVSMDYEKLLIHYNYDNNEYEISAYIELFNHNDTAVHPLVGFELDQNNPSLRNKDYFKDYVLLVNDEPQPFELQVIVDEDAPLSPYTYTLLYRPEFKPGLNRVYHEYTLQSGLGSLEGLCVYVLKTGARWKGGVIKDFEIIVKSSSPGMLRIKPAAFSDFDVVGEGKIFTGVFGVDSSYESNQYERTFSLNTGYLHKRIQDFHPTRNLVLYFFPFHYWGYYYGSASWPYIDPELFYTKDPEVPFPTHKFIYYWKRSLDSFKDDIPGNDDAEHTFKLYEERITGMDKHELRILRNTLYALHGCVFSDRALQKYFDDQYWYYPNAVQKPEDISLDETSKEILQKIRVAENAIIDTAEQDAPLDSASEIVPVDTTLFTAGNICVSVLIAAFVLFIGSLIRRRTKKSAKPEKAKK